jgi:hypothetical protein
MKGVRTELSLVEHVRCIVVGLWGYNWRLMKISCVLPAGLGRKGIFD